jgi:fructokinase
MPLPWPRADEIPAPPCWCGRSGCCELYVSGTGLEQAYARAASERTNAQGIIEAMRRGEAAAVSVFDRYLDRLARGLAVICDVIDPDVIVLGGGLSNVAELYDRLPNAIAPYVFTDRVETLVRPAIHGDSSGVRGAAWLWPPP